METQHLDENKDFKMAVNLPEVPGRLPLGVRVNLAALGIQCPPEKVVKHTTCSAGTLTVKMQVQSKNI